MHLVVRDPLRVDWCPMPREVWQWWRPTATYFSTRWSICYSTTSSEVHSSTGCVELLPSSTTNSQQPTTSSTTVQRCTGQIYKSRCSVDGIVQLRVSVVLADVRWVDTVFRLWCCVLVNAEPMSQACPLCVVLGRVRINFQQYSAVI